MVPAQAKLLMAQRPSTPSLLLRWLCLAPIPLLWCLVAQFAWLEFAETKTLDWRFRFRGERDAPVKVVYVDVDDLSLNEIGGWPWDRDHIRKVAQTLIEDAGVKAIGVDIVLSDLGKAEISDLTRMRKGNISFLRYLRAKSPPLVLAASYTADEYRDNRGMLSRRHLPLVASETIDTESLNAPELPSFDVGRTAQYNPPGAAFIDTINGGTRLVPLFAPSNIQTYHHMSLELVRLYLGATREGVLMEDTCIRMVDVSGRELVRIPVMGRQLLEVNWFSAWTSERNPRISFSTVLNYANMLGSEDPDEAKRKLEREKAREFFKNPELNGAIVLIGPTAKLLQDLGPAPFDGEPVPKVGVHGNLIKTILAGEYLHRLPMWRGWAIPEFVIILVLTALSLLLALKGGPWGALLKAAGVLVLVLYVASAFVLFASAHWVLPLVSPLSAAFTTAFAGLIWQVVLEEKQKGRIKGMFSTYLAPTVVQGLIDSGKEPELGGHDAEITPYFSDIQNFSSFSEVLSAAQLTDLLNEYLSACTDIVQGEGGTLDKYIGDAVVAMYGAPVVAEDHAFRACVASQLVHRRIAELREKWKSEGSKWPVLVHQLQTRIGLNTGVCMIGNMGSSTRFNYTMMGDNVNLAARMESGAKSWGVYTMCTESTRLACEKHGQGRVIFRPLGRIVVKGRSQAVPIHEIMGLREQLDDKALECRELFAQGLEKMYARNWSESLVLFARAAMLEPNQPGRTPGIKTNASLVRLEKVKHYQLEEPPRDWDGVEVMTEK